MMDRPTQHPWGIIRPMQFGPNLHGCLLYSSTPVIQWNKLELFPFIYLVSFFFFFFFSFSLVVYIHWRKIFKNFAIRIIYNSDNKYERVLNYGAHMSEQVLDNSSHVWTSEFYKSSLTFAVRSKFVEILIQVQI
jgi:hypothetical protein